MAKRILIVEDNDLNLKLFRDVLTANQFEVIETKDGNLAVEMTKAEMPDLILMDIQLPEISGLDIIKDMKQNNSNADIAHISIIAVTAFAMKDDEERILRAGCEA